MSNSDWKNLFIVACITMFFSWLILGLFWLATDSRNNPRVEWTKTVHNGDLFIVKTTPDRGFSGDHVEFFLTDQACQNPNNSYLFNWGSRWIHLSCKEGGSRYTDDDNTLNLPDDIQFMKQGDMPSTNLN